MEKEGVWGGLIDLEALYPEVLYLEPGGCLGLGVITAGSPQVSVASLQFLLFKGLGQLLHEGMVSGQEKWQSSVASTEASE